jgi:formiminoglutamase
MSEINFLNIYNQSKIDTIVRKRKHETKLGQQVKTIEACNNFEELQAQIDDSKAQFILLGLPEDIGVRANYGRGGAHTAWAPALDNILNIQSNSFLNGSELLVLGHISFDDLMNDALGISNKTDEGITLLRNLTKRIDDRVYEVIKALTSSKKTLIIIGGGHNNSYPIIKGFSVSRNQALSIINIDPHSDFRPMEGRHSGNGFSYAFAEKFISNYFVIGLHESYNSGQVIDELNKNENIHYYTYEDIAVREKISIDEVVEQCAKKIEDNIVGIEIDLDAIQNIPTSAKTSSGFLPVDVRKMVSNFSSKLKPLYIHIAEGAPILSHIKTDNKTGKLIAYLITDFIKASQ